MSVNFSDINTVTDLLNAQEPKEIKTSVSDNIVRQILNEEPTVGMEICIAVLGALKEFHGTGVEHYIDEKNAEYAAQWASDYTKLDTAITLISDIQV